MKEQILVNEEVRKQLDITMAMAMIRYMHRKDLISKDVLAYVEKNYKKMLKKSNKCANMDIEQMWERVEADGKKNSGNICKSLYRT